MKKLILVLVILLSLFGCTKQKTVNEIRGEEFKEFVNKHLNEYPVSLTYNDGENEITTENEEIINLIYNAISSMKVGNKTNFAFADDEKKYIFKYADGDTMEFIIIRMAGEDFIYNPNDFNLYTIEDDYGLFDIEIK